MLLAQAFPVLFELTARGKTIYRGAFSEVREVTDKASGTKYAMKIIDIEQSHAENVAVDNEIQILKNLRHPNIIRLFDVYWGNTKIFLVMELYPIFFCLRGRSSLLLIIIL